MKGEYVVTSINASTELKSAEAFAALPVKTSGDSRVLLGDVARVEMGAENYDTVSSFDGTRRCTSASRPPRRPTRWT